MTCLRIIICRYKHREVRGSLDYDSLVLEIAMTGSAFTIIYMTSELCSLHHARLVQERLALDTGNVYLPSFEDINVSISLQS